MACINFLCLWRPSWQWRPLVVAQQPRPRGPISPSPRLRFSISIRLQLQSHQHQQQPHQQQLLVSQGEKKNKNQDNQQQKIKPETGSGGLWGPRDSSPMLCAFLLVDKKSKERKEKNIRRISPAAKQTNDKWTDTERSKDRTLGQADTSKLGYGLDDLLPGILHIHT